MICIIYKTLCPADISTSASSAQALVKGDKKSLPFQGRWQAKLGGRLQFFLAQKSYPIFLAFMENGNVALELNNPNGFYPFGMRLAGLSTNSGNDNKHLYSGKELEDDFDLHWYHYGARYYDPQLGRWNAVDPADEFYSAYVYCHNDPVNFFDPDGFSEEHWSEKLMNFVEGCFIAYYRARELKKEIEQIAYDANVNSPKEAFDYFIKPEGISLSFTYWGITGGINPMTFQDNKTTYFMYLGTATSPNFSLNLELVSTNAQNAQDYRKGFFSAHGNIPLKTNLGFSFSHSRGIDDRLSFTDVSANSYGLSFSALQKPSLSFSSTWYDALELPKELENQ
jgi:RHS repeat-associated protein